MLCIRKQTFAECHTITQKMSRPGLIPHRMKSMFHQANCCIDVRRGKVHAIKANLYNRIWHNTVGLESASISVNKKTVASNRLVRNAKEPFHLLSYGTGADTMYWGRYICVGGTDTFELEYVDDGLLHLCETTATKSKRSFLETLWADAFEKHGIKAIFEPVTARLPGEPFGQIVERMYNPDFWLPEANVFIEIKGPPPKDEEFLKCKLTRNLGFKIKMFHGSPDGFTEYDWDAKGRMTSKKHKSFYKYLHPERKRKRRKIYNVA